MSKLKDEEIWEYLQYILQIVTVLCTLSYYKLVRWCYKKLKDKAGNLEKKNQIIKHV